MRGGKGPPRFFINKQTIMLKVYGISGYTETNIKIPVNGGKAWFECEFRHGRIGAGLGNRAATYATNDPTIQNIIEDSHFFGRMIHLVRTAEAPAPKKVEAPAAPKVVEVPSVSTREEAIAFLKQRGAKASNLKDDTAIRSYMYKIGVSFPNLSF